MDKLKRKKITWIAGGIAAYGLLNGVLFYLYPASFSAFAYIIFLLVPLFAVVMLIFARFSMVFIKRIEEKEEEEKLLQERQKEIVENMVEGLVVHNLEGKILGVNGAAESFLGMKEFQLKGKTAANIESPTSLLRALFMDSSQDQEIEFSYKNESGQELFYRIIKVFLSKERGEILKIIRDVTRAKYLDRMKTEYITIMSHKFLTPLTNIKWAAGILKGQSLSDAKKEIKKEESIKNILDNADELIEFTSHLLNITEIEEGLYGYKFEKVDMGELAEEAIKNSSEEIIRHGITVSFNDPRKNFYFVRGDKNRLAIAVANYLDNSIKYTPEGGTVELSLRQDKENVRLGVKDSGVGVSPESVPDLFTKFFRDKRAKAVHTEGSGVGLFIVKNIIEKHGGKVGYEPNEDGVGSVFYFTLPVYKEGR